MKTLLALSGLIAGLASANAADLFYVANLTPGQEAFHNDDPQGVPPDRSGTGTADFTLTDTGSFSYSISYSGLSANSTAAHVHGPGAVGADAPVIFGLQGTLGAQQGSFAGSVNLTPTQITDLNNGLWYVNIHSGNFPVGEIRGQISAVPEPGSVALVAAAGGLMLAFRRKRASVS